MNLDRRSGSLASWLLLAILALSIPVVGAEAADTWQTGDGYRFMSLTVSTGGHAGFSLQSSTVTGLLFTNRLSESMVASNRLLELGSGVALGDVDGDGRVDVYFCRLQGDNALYRNLGGWKFADVTAEAGVGCPNQFSTGCALVDLDGDGDLDLLVNSLGGGTRMWTNDGKGRFTEAANPSLQKLFGATSLALADVDGDGDLDLYVCNYRTDTFFDYPPGLVMYQRRRPDGAMVVEPTRRFLTLTNPVGGLELLEKGEPDFLYLNRGGGEFELAPWDSGFFRDEDDRPLTEPPADWGLSVTFRDLNGDGLPDLYVCNDFVYWPDRIWLNQGGKGFRAAPKLALRNVSLASMAVDIADLNRDGYADLFVADMLSPRREFRAWQRPDTLRGMVRWPVERPDFRPEVPRNTLQLARGDGTFAEIAQWAGLAATDWTWGVVFLDVDLDGWEDLLVATGANHDVQDSDALTRITRSVGWKTHEMRLKAFAMLPNRALPSIAMRNRGDLTFEDRSKEWGFDAVGVAHGMALGDLDNDGALDVVINCLNGPARVFRNLSTAPRLGVRLKGRLANTRGIGAKIRVTGGTLAQTQEMIAGGRYLSSDDPMRVFAAAGVDPLDIEVTWRSGRRSVVKGAQPNRIYEIVEPESGVPAPVEPGLVPVVPLFEDVSSRLAHVHQDTAFDDFARQPLLHRRLSTLGPGVAWFDVNGDSVDDLIVGGGKNGRGALFLGDGAGGFTGSTDPSLAKPNTRDQTGVLGWRSKDGVRLISGVSNWDEAATDAPSLETVALAGAGESKPLPVLEGPLSVSGPLAMADVDGDGDLDLFVGGRATAGRYPEPAASHLLRNEGDRFTVLRTFPQFGLISSAIFTDVDGDGDPDLALACEWDSIRLFRNDRGVYTEVTEAMGLSSFKGWWNGVAAGDVDGDGRMDLVASNWGRNWRTDQPVVGGNIPVLMYYGEFAGNGVVQTLMASLDPAQSNVVAWPERRRVVSAIPSIAAAWPTHHAYGRASVEGLLGGKFSAARKLEATVFDSMVFLNRGDRFEGRPLPMEAQFAPAFGVSLADFDGDGNEDVFLAQNFFGMDAETSRQDAGLGLLLLGDGRGGFKAQGPHRSGISISGEQRASAVTDIDGDGRMDLVVTQHGGPTRLFRNRGGIVGVRVKVRGLPANPEAVGATLRLRQNERWSRAIELHCGGGYWSQDSTGIVMATQGIPTSLWVRWPGGKVQDLPWPAGATSVEVSTDGIRQR